MIFERNGLGTRIEFLSCSHCDAGLIVLVYLAHRCGILDVDRKYFVYFSEKSDQRYNTAKCLQ
jgi:hypothetical protein